MFAVCRTGHVSVNPTRRIKTVMSVASEWADFRRARDRYKNGKDDDDDDDRPTADGRTGEKR